MKVYARVEGGIVQEIVQPNPDEEGNERPIEERFAADFVAQMVEVTGLNPPPACWWVYDGEHFKAPEVYRPSAEEIRASNTSARDTWLAKAALAIAPLQDAVDLGDATADDAALLIKWKQYRVAVNRVDLTLLAADWPVAPGS